MTETMVQEELPQGTAAGTPAAATEPPPAQPPAPPPAKPKKSAASRKRRRRIIRTVIVLLILGGVGFAAWKYFGGGDSAAGETEIIRDTVRYDAITSMVEGSGLTKAKNSETITLNTAGTVLDVFVTEGQQVAAGDPLFTIDSPAARTAVETAQNNVNGYQKQLSTALKDIAGLNLAAPHGGKIRLGEEYPRLNPGDEISKGTPVAQINDDTRLRLVQYYSYAYAGELYVGQAVDVSIPVLMSSVPGTVDAVHMVNRITDQGSQLFSVEILVENEGALTADMAASATVSVGNETIYPYEPGKLEYFRTSVLRSTVDGTVISSGLIDYLQVSEGQVLVQIDGEESESEIFTIEKDLEEAQEELRVAQENLDNCSAVAPIGGKVIGLSVTPGSEIPANTTMVTISDTSSIIINATVDEMKVSYLQPGMMVDLDQYGTYAMGIVESVSLSSTVSNGVAMYPIVISADNMEETLQVNGYIHYSLVASQNDNCLVLPIQAVRTVGLEDGSMVTVVYVEAEEPPENAIEVPFVDEEIPEGFWPVPVEIGIQDNSNVEIKSGVEEGTVVFTQVLSQNVWG